MRCIERRFSDWLHGRRQGLRGIGGRVEFDSPNTTLLLPVDKRLIPTFHSAAAGLTIDRCSGGTRRSIPRHGTVSGCAFPTELEDVHGIGRRAHGHECADGIECDGMYPCPLHASPELIQLLCTWQAEYADDGAFRGTRSQHRSGTVYAEQCDGGLVGLDDVDDG